MPSPARWLTAGPGFFRMVLANPRCLHVFRSNLGCGWDGSLRTGTLTGGRPFRVFHMTQAGTDGPHPDHTNDAFGLCLRDEGVAGWPDC